MVLSLYFVIVFILFLFSLPETTTNTLTLTSIYLDHIILFARRLNQHCYWARCFVNIFLGLQNSAHVGSSIKNMFSTTNYKRILESTTIFLFI